MDALKSIQFIIVLPGKTCSLGNPSITQVCCLWRVSRPADRVLAFSLHRRYILWVSSVVQRFSPENACLHFLNLNESVSLSVILEYDGSNTTIFDRSVEAGNFYACTSFQVTQREPKWEQKPILVKLLFSN